MACKACEREAVTAAATEPFDAAFPVPLYPPSTWFTEKPDWLQPDTKIAVDDEGRVAGYFYNADQCLVHDHGACPRPSPTNYAGFHQQDVVVDTGEVMRVGAIGNTNGHASAYARVDVAQAHYADPDRQLMIGRAYDDEHGGYFLGAMVPGKTYGDVALVRRSALSGDWRPMPPQWWSANNIAASVVTDCEGFDCIGPTFVTRPGLPLVRAYTDHGRAAAILGGVGGIQLDEQEYDMSAQTIELPDGTKIITPVSPTEASTARTAASPIPPKAPPSSGAEPPAEQQTEGDLEQRVAALEAAMSAVVQKLSEMMQTQMAAMEASLAPLPEADAPLV